MPDHLFDLVLSVLLVLLAWRIISNPNLLAASVLFIIFGLSLSLAWVRLGAPDIALIEAGIGAGLMGALLIDTAGYLRDEKKPGDPGRKR